MSRVSRRVAAERDRAQAGPAMPPTGRFPVATGVAEILLDDDLPGASMLLLDGVPQSSVNLDDPTAVGFDYVRSLADVVDAIAPAPQPLRVLHLGAGALTLARYVAARRPGSRQTAVEVDPALAELVRRRFGVPAGTKLRVADAREVVAALRAGTFDLVVDDAFVAGRAPGGLGGVAALARIAGALGPGGAYAANVSLAGPEAGAAVRRRLAALAATFPHLSLSGPAKVVRGRTAGNLVVAAAADPLPVAALERAVARRSRPLALLADAEVRAMAEGAVPDP